VQEEIIEQSVLAGEWVAQDSEDDSILIFDFNSVGTLTAISKRTPEGETITGEINDTVTTINGKEVIVTVTVANVISTYNATLNPDEDTMDGRISTRIDFRSVDIVIPAGDLVLQKVE
jgi:hypothetical protein